MNDIPETAAELRELGVDVYVVATGAGAGIQKALWSIPGISNVFVGASFPYAATEMNEFLGFKPESYCSEETALDMATQAFIKAKTSSFLRGEEKPAAGLAITASVASIGIHRGDHRIHAAVVSDKGCWLWSHTLIKGKGLEFREKDGTFADEMGIDLLRHSILRKPLRRPIQQAAEIIEVKERVGEQFWKYPYFLPTGHRKASIAPFVNCLFPGSFNPIHDGHRSMADEIQIVTTNSSTGFKPVVYLINVDSPHKGTMDIVQTLTKVSMLKAEWHKRNVSHPILFTKGQPLYVDKVRAHPRTSFVIGADTLDRMLDPKWGVDPKDVLNTLKEYESHFYVYSRGSDGVRVSTIFKKLGFDANHYRPMFEELVGRWTISSTEIRNSQANK